MTNPSNKGAVFNSSQTLPSIDLDAILTRIKSVLSPEILEKSINNPTDSSNALVVNLSHIINEFINSGDKGGKNDTLFDIKKISQFNQQMSSNDKLLFIGSRIEDPESPKTRVLINEIKKTLQFRISKLIQSPTDLYLYDREIVNFLGNQLNKPELKAEGKKFLNNVLKVSGKTLNAEIRSLVDHDHAPHLKPSPHDLIVLQCFLTRAHKEQGSLRQALLDAYDRYLHDAHIQPLLEDQLALEGDEDDDEIADALDEAIQIRLKMAKKELDNPHSVASKFIQFIENDVESRLLLYISMGIMTDISEAIRSVRHAPHYKNAIHYLDSIKWLYEQYARTPYTDKVSNSFTIPIPSDMGIPGTSTVKASDHLELKRFFDKLPVMLTWRNKLKDDDHTKGVERIFVFKFRLNGIDPEQGLTIYDKKFEEFKHLLIKATSGESDYTFSRQHFDHVLSQICVIVAAALHQEMAEKYSLSTIIHTVAGRLLTKLREMTADWSNLNKKEREHLITEYTESLAKKYRPYYDKVTSELTKAIRDEAIEFNPSHEDKVNLFISPELLDLNPNAKSFIRDHKDEAFRWYSYVTLGRVDSQSESVRKARKRPLQTIEYSSTRMVKRLHPSTLNETHKYTKDFYTGESPDDRPRLLVHIGKQATNKRSEYSKIKRNLFAYRDNDSQLEVMSGLYLTVPDIALEYVQQRHASTTNTLDHASIARLEAFVSVFSILSLIVIETLIEMIDSHNRAILTSDLINHDEQSESNTDLDEMIVNPRSLKNARPLISLFRIQEDGKGNEMNVDDLLLSCSHALMNHLNYFTPVNMQGFVAQNIEKSFSSESIYNSLLSNNRIRFECHEKLPLIPKMALITLSVRPGFQIGATIADQYIAIGKIFTVDTNQSVLELSSQGGFVDDYSLSQERKLHFTQKAIIDLYEDGYTHIAIIEDNYNENRLDRTEREIDQLSTELYRRLTHEYENLRLYPMTSEKVMVLNENKTKNMAFEIHGINQMERITQNLMTPQYYRGEDNHTPTTGALRPIYLFATLNAVQDKLHHRGLMTYQLNVPSALDPHDPLVRNCFQLYDREGEPIYNTLVGLLRTLHFARSEKLPQGKTMRVAPVLEPLTEVQSDSTAGQNGEVVLYTSRKRRSIRLSVNALLQHINSRLLNIQKDNV